MPTSYSTKIYRSQNNQLTDRNLGVTTSDRDNSSPMKKYLKHDIDIKGVLKQYRKDLNNTMKSKSSTNVDVPANKNAKSRLQTDNKHQRAESVPTEPEIAEESDENTEIDSVIFSEEEQ